LICLPLTSYINWGKPGKLKITWFHIFPKGSFEATGDDANGGGHPARTGRRTHHRNGKGGQCVTDPRPVDTKKVVANPVQPVTSNEKVPHD